MTDAFLQTERGCVVLDQPQHVGHKNPLRLVCDTAPLRRISPL